MTKQTFATKKRRKTSISLKEMSLNIDMDSIPNEDIYGYYIMNRMEESGVYNLPLIGDFHDDYPDYITLFNHPNDYTRTPNTCVSFYIDDLKFDDIDGLYEAIIYKDVYLLKYYKSRLSGIRYIIAPDYSMFGNFKESTLIHQLEKQCVVIGWLVLELNAIVYPNITYGLQHTFAKCFGIIYHGSNVALSLKGCSTGKNAGLLKEAIRYLVDNVKPRSIIVYSVNSDKTIYSLLKYAIDNNVKVFVLDNVLKNRNIRRLAANG